MRRTLRAPSYFAYTTLFRSGHLVARQENIGKVVPIYIPDGNSPSIVEISVFVNIEIGIECESVLKVNTCHLRGRSEEHTSELQSRGHLVCRLLLEKKNKILK